MPYLSANKFLIAFFVLSFVHLGAEYVQYVPLILLTKPLLISFLSVYFYLSTSVVIWRNWLLAGLCFSVIGDVLLMFNEQYDDLEIFFQLGLLSFLFTHMCYIQALVRSAGKALSWLGQPSLIILPFCILWLGANLYFWDQMPVNLRAPVLIYSLVLLSMFYTVVRIYKFISRPAGNLIFLGALLFVVSDSLIAVNKFQLFQLYPRQARLLIMCSYLLAQFAIVHGSILVQKSGKRQVDNC